jgi:hypothetical protein
LGRAWRQTGVQQAEGQKPQSGGRAEYQRRFAPNNVARAGKQFLGTFISDLPGYTLNVVSGIPYEAAERRRGTAELACGHSDRIRDSFDKISSGHKLLAHVSLEPVARFRCERRCCLFGVIADLVSGVDELRPCLPGLIPRRRLIVRALSGQFRRSLILSCGWALLSWTSPLV